MTAVAHRRPHTPPLASPFLEFDLTAEVDRLHGETTWNTGQNVDLLPGSLLALDHRAPHDLEALEESAVLLTIAWLGGRHESINDNDGRSQT